jgi:fibronectin type 3 domain-containing protein
MLGSGSVSDVTQAPSTVADSPDVEINHGDQELFLSWDEPNMNGDTVASYDIFRSLNGSHYCLLDNIQDNSYTDSSLTNGTTYYYKIRAVGTLNGNGQFSAPVSEYPSTIPAPPDALIPEDINHLGNGEQVKVSWEQDPNDVSVNGGSPITSFDVFRGNTPQLIGTVNATNATSYSYTDMNNNLVNGEAYIYSIKSSNRDGQSSATVADPIAPSGLPDAPANLRIQVNSNFLLVAWNLLANAPSNLPNDENSAILNYNIYRDGEFIHSVNASTNNYSDYSIVGNNGVVYGYQISAVSANGEGALCETVSQSSASRPDVPANFQAVHGDSEIELSWDLLNSAPYPASNPSDEGRSVSLYNIYQSSDNVTVNLLTTVSGSTSSTTISNLTNGVMQYFQLSATNSRGESDQTSVISCIPSTSPAVVRNVDIQSADGELIVNWAKPLDQNGLPNGGLAFTYTISVRDLGGGLAYSNSMMSTPQVEVTGLVDNVTYQIDITADNGVDTNYHTYSTEATVIPKPDEISGLVSAFPDNNPITIQFTYDTDYFSADQFVVIVFDATRSTHGAYLFDASLNRVANQQGTYDYSVQLNSSNVGISSMLVTDVCYISIIAHNSYGNSPLSHTIRVN